MLSTKMTSFLSDDIQMTLRVCSFESSSDREGENDFHGPCVSLSTPQVPVSVFILFTPSRKNYDQKP